MAVIYQGENKAQLALEDMMKQIAKQTSDAAMKTWNQPLEERYTVEAQKGEDGKMGYGLQSVAPPKSQWDVFWAQLLPGLNKDATKWSNLGMAKEPAEKVAKGKEGNLALMRALLGGLQGQDMSAMAKSLESVDMDPEKMTQSLMQILMMSQMMNVFGKKDEGKKDDKAK